MGNIELIPCWVKTPITTRCWAQTYENTHPSLVWKPRSQRRKHSGGGVEGRVEFGYKKKGAAMFYSHIGRLINVDCATHVERGDDRFLGVLLFSMYSGCTR